MTEPFTQEHTVQMTASGLPRPGCPGEFEILAITAGEGNGWRFSEKVLQESLPLWQELETFIDHGSPLNGGRSIRDLAGVCSQPEYDPAAKGIRLVLKAAGPSAGLLETIGRDWLNLAGARPRIGFSADITFTAHGRDVERILKVTSLDLVANPARGGAFIRSLNQAEPNHPTDQGGPMQNDPSEIPAASEASPAGDLNSPVAAALQKLNVQACAALLEAELLRARLPEAAARRVRRRFSGAAFEPQELAEEIESARSLVAELKSGQSVSGARITAVAAPEDRLQAAVDDLFGAERDVQMQGKRVERLSGIRELYLALTGDYDMNGGIGQTRLATTATMPALVKNALNKLVVQKWDELGRAGYRWWEKVAAVEHFDSLHDITGTLVGEVGSLPAINEGAEYTELPITDSEETGVWKKYGGYLPLTLELIDRDDLSRLKSYPAKLAAASLRQISALVASIFTSDSGTGPLMKDTYHVFDDTHHRNLGAVALSSANWEAAAQALYTQDMLSGASADKPHLALDPRYLLVPRPLRLTAMRILYPSWERESGIVSENMQRGDLGDVITVPEWTDSDNWAAVCDPRLAPGIIIGERFGLQPEIIVAGDPTSPAVFANDEVRLKIRHFISVFVADYRPLYKSNYS